MAKNERPLKVEIPRPADEHPAWSKVGIIGVVGFVVGIAWPRLLGVQIGPNVPGETRGPAAASPAAQPPSGEPTAAPDATAAPGPADTPAPSNRQLADAEPGTIAKCSNDKGKKVDDCGDLEFDKVALPRLRELAKCPAVLGLEGKVSVGLDIDFDKKQINVLKGKKTSVPGTTVQGILQCAAREFANVSLDDIPHKQRRYSVYYAMSFYPPGKHPEETAKDEAPAAGEAASEAGTSSALVSWDTALLRKDPKDGDVVARLVRGTKVKVISRQNDWYKVESNAKTGWVYRGAIGL